MIDVVVWVDDECRNPFLSRAGFDKKKKTKKKIGGARRNPFLSRAGFDKSLGYPH